MTTTTETNVDGEVRAALTAVMLSADVADLKVRVDAIHAATTEAQATARRRAIDPMSTADEAAAARSENDRLGFDAERLAAQSKALGDRVLTLRRTEEADKRRLEYDAAKAERDALVEEIRTKYPALTAELVDLFRRMVASDARIANAAAPEGCERLAPAEAVARGAPANFVVSGHPMELERITAARLPSMAINVSSRGEPIWPPRQERTGGVVSLRASG